METILTICRMIDGKTGLFKPFQDKRGNLYVILNQ
jgi:hypothetical protein